MDSKKQLFFIFGVAFSAILIYVFIRVAGENEETRIRRRIYAAVVGIEKEEIGRCATFLSGAYRDPSGRDKAAFLASLTQIFKEFDGFKIVIKQLAIETKGASAAVDVGFKVYFRRSGEEKLYYDTGKLKIDFIKEGRDWNVLEVNYSGSGDLLFLQGVA